MTDEEIAILDENVQEAYSKLVELNKKYNDLLISIHDEDKGAKKEQTPEIKSSVRRIIQCLYWIIYFGSTIAYLYKFLPINFYLAIASTNIIFYRALSRVLPDRQKNKSPNNSKKDEFDRDELYSELTEARELYQTLRKQRDEVVTKGYTEVREEQQQVEEKNKTLSLFLGKNEEE